MHGRFMEQNCLIFMNRGGGGGGAGGIVLGKGD